MKHPRASLTIVILSGLLLSGCGASSVLSSVGAQILNVQMWGITESPATATGTTLPDFQDYQLLGVAFVSADSTEAVVLYDGSKPKIYRIVNREQIIYSKDISKYSGKSYSGLVLTFDATVTGDAGSHKNMSFQLTSPTVTYGEAFTVATGKGLTFDIQVKWRNTVTGSTMAEPEIAITKEN